MRGGEQRIFPAGHVAADGIDRNVLVAENHARQRLDLDVAHRFTLMLREVAHLFLREPDVVEIAPGQLRQAILDLCIGQPEILAVPLVELDRQFADRCIPALFDIGQNPFHRGADFRIVFGALRGIAAALENFWHRRLLLILFNGLRHHATPPR